MRHREHSTEDVDQLLDEFGSETEDLDVNEINHDQIIIINSDDVSSNENESLQDEMNAELNIDNDGYSWDSGHKIITRSRTEVKKMGPQK